MRKKLLELFAVFCTGAVGYGTVEVIERGFSHITMALLGGMSMIVIHLLNDDRRRGGSVIVLLGISTAFITSCELLAGEILNVYMEMHIWNYSGQPLNFDGVICPRYTGCWLLLSAFAMIVDDLMRRKIFRQPLEIDYFGVIAFVRRKRSAQYSLGELQVERRGELDV
ncbi:Putative ABC-transporter type IV [Ruminococcaceae bacterium FB2012]|nr:Putative ABC-transporter type IV [Ruminococcaceae bacterium FB2012]